MSDDERDIGICLSGGGHRATVFGLGALLAIADAGLRRRTLSISSVSGGSIANGSVMVGPDYGTADPTEIEAHVAKVVKAIADRGVLLGGAPATKWYLRSFIGLLVLTAVGVIVAVAFAIAGEPVIFGITLGVGIVFGALALWTFGRRSVVTEQAIDRELLGGTRTTLADQAARNLSVHHVICTTELQAGTTFYFSNRLAYGWEFGGTTEPSKVPLSTPVQASACVPGAFRPRVVRLEALNLKPAKATVTKGAETRTVAVERIVLEDGGVYDNMADEWEYGFSNRLKNWPGVGGVQARAARRLVVVNASADWNRLMPLAGRGLKLEVNGLLRSQGVQYDVSTSHRRRALTGLFKYSATTEDPNDTEGVFVQIRDSPYRLLRLFEPKPGWTPDDRGRWALEARAFLDRYGISEDEWTTIAKKSAGVATTLAPLGSEVCASLLEHGYMLTLANLHVMFGYGDLDQVVDRNRFKQLAAGNAGGAS